MQARVRSLGGRHGDGQGRSALPADAGGEEDALGADHQAAGEAGGAGTRSCALCSRRVSTGEHRTAGGRLLCSRCANHIAAALASEHAAVARLPVALAAGAAGAAVAAAAWVAAVLLTGHEAGYGALLVDPRGHGDSGGRLMDFGWGAERDAHAAVSWVLDRPEVTGGVALFGLSMGGEIALTAAAGDRPVERGPAIIASPVPRLVVVAGDLAGAL